MREPHPLGQLPLGEAALFPKGLEAPGNSMSLGNDRIRCLRLHRSICKTITPLATVHDLIPTAEVAAWKVAEEVRALGCLMERIDRADGVAGRRDAERFLETVRQAERLPAPPVGPGEYRVLNGKILGGELDRRN